MEDLVNKKCIPCQGGTPPMGPLEITAYLSQLKQGCKFLESNKITKEFEFEDFKEAIAFVNKVADLAENEGHHPDIAIHYNKVEMLLWTHKINGLTESDFILAAKIDQLLEQ